MLRKNAPKLKTVSFIYCLNFPCPQNLPRISNWDCHSFLTGLCYVEKLDTTIILLF